LQFTQREKDDPQAKKLQTLASHVILNGVLDMKLETIAATTELLAQTAEEFIRYPEDARTI
jgi:hypothetical protein